MRAPLQHEIVSLIGRGFHRPRDLLRVLGQRYDISPDTVRVTLWKLARRGVIKRVARGVYEAE
jgi:DNA-binding GntR family transcriptional regulator